MQLRVEKYLFSNFLGKPQGEPFSVLAGLDQRMTGRVRAREPARAARPGASRAVPVERLV